MKILKTNQNKVDKKVIDEAVKVLADGGVILYPTDTVYVWELIFSIEKLLKEFTILRKEAI